MCSLDFSDGYVRLLSASSPVARQCHQCRECRRDIAAGERYHVERYVWEGRMHTHRTCAHCKVARRWLEDRCGGYTYGDVREDVVEHARNVGRNFALMRAAVGMRRKWRAPSGRLLPLPVLQEERQQ